MYLLALGTTKLTLPYLVASLAAFEDQPPFEKRKQRVSKKRLGFEVACKFNGAHSQTLRRLVWWVFFAKFLLGIIFFE